MALLENIQNNHAAFLETLKHRFLDKDRTSALQRFFQYGFPTRKDEEYKYTNLREITEKNYNFFPSEAYNFPKEKLDDLLLGEENFDRVVFVNGILNKELSKISIENVEFLSFNYALNDPLHKEVFEKYFDKIAAKNLAFTNLNSAYCK